MSDEAQDAAKPRFGAWMGSMWLYTTLRFGLFAVLWLIIWALGVGGYLAALIALVLSVPLSLVLLAKPRAAFTRQLEMRVNARRVDSADLATQLDPDAAKDDDLSQFDEAATAREDHDTP